MASRPARAAQGGEGANAAQRRAGAATSGAAVGSDRQGVSIRDRRGERLARRPLPRTFAAARLPLHVWARLHGGVSVLLAVTDGFKGVADSLAHPRVDPWGVSAPPPREPQAFKP